MHLDYIPAPCSQEDDAHNVQSVIDSLSLDYLQISLSHITGMGEVCYNTGFKCNICRYKCSVMISVTMFAGENVVRGDKESIKNLLEIFDGLLEYLNEEITEDLQNGGRQMVFVTYHQRFNN